MPHVNRNEKIGAAQRGGELRVAHRRLGTGNRKLVILGVQSKMDVGHSRPGAGKPRIGAWSLGLARNPLRIGRSNPGVFRNKPRIFGANPGIVASILEGRD